MMKDFLCEPCNEVYEDLVEPDTRMSPCPVCGQPGEQILSTPMIGQMNDPMKRNEALKKRSEKHSRKETGKQLEKFGMDTNRDYKKWKESN